ncbi:MAG: acetylxylan esterase [Bacteroides sp.]|nr:acetylxylan esterase [Bacteroides sp.]
MKTKLLSVLIGLLMVLGVSAQPALQKVQLVLVPNHENATYRLGEQAKFKVIALDCGVMLNDIQVDFEVSEDLMPAHVKKSITLKGNEGTIQAGTMKEPGYLRVKASVKHEGKTYTSLSTVGFEAEKLMPLVKLPTDFDEYWSNTLKLLDKVELAPKMERIAERCTDKVEVYHISYGNIKGTRMYGVLTMPKKEGKYPAILRVPGAGVHAMSGNVAWAAKGVIVLEIGIHGIPVIMEGSVYTDLGKGVLANYVLHGIENRDSYFFRRVYLGCVKAVDFLLSLPNSNGKVGVMGGSQGGMLSMATSYLDKRITATGVYFPAFCDQEAYMHGRTGGWPHFFKNKDNCKKEYLETVRYYDGANFARNLKAPVYYAYGYNDITCGPTTSTATYNAIPAPKQVVIGPNEGHWLFQEHINGMWEWMIKELNK